MSTRRTLASFVFCAMVWQAGVSQEPTKAPFDVATAEAKASQGDMTAMVSLGEAYWGKQGIPADVDRGRMWLEKAADAGSLEAQMFLGSAYLIGSQLPKDPALAAKYFLRAAQQQQPTDQTLRGAQALAQFFVANLYEEGEGLERSHEKAIVFLKESADNGNYPAEFQLGSLYNDGLGGIAQDKAQACKLFEEAADQGHTMAMHNTGYCYQSGVGVKKDLDKAIHYYPMATEAGSDRSGHNLAMVYGELGEADKAYFWLRVVQSSGYAEDPVLIETAKARLSPAQVSQKEQEVITWRGAHKAKQTGAPAQ
jgi:TPR repeat protein